GSRQPLLYENVLAGLQRLLGDGEVRGRWRRDDHRPDATAVKDPVRGLDRGRPRKVSLDETAALRTGIHDVLDFAAWKSGEVPKEVGPAVAAPDLGDDERHRVHRDAMTIRG